MHPDNEVLYADLYQDNVPLKTYPPSTVPVSILATSARPDMVLMRSTEIFLLEFTVPYDSREQCKSKEVIEKLIPRVTWGPRS